MTTQLALIAGLKRQPPTLSYAAAFVLAVLATTFGTPFAALAKEFDKPPLADKDHDWLQSHRLEWQTLSVSETVENLKQISGAHFGTFLRAATFNVKDNRPGEYQTIAQRNALYDIVSFVIEHSDEPEAPKAIRNVRFFAAANLVTTKGQIGGVEYNTVLAMNLAADAGLLSPEWKIGDGARKALTAINAELFALNLRVIRDLMFVWKEPRDPSVANPTKAIDPLTFDLKMVELEQDRVQKWLDANASAVPPGVVKQINSAFDHPGYRDIEIELGRYRLTLPLSGRDIKKTPKEWLAALNFSSFDFAQKSHRVAMGKAIIFFLHGKSKDEFLHHMK